MDGRGRIRTVYKFESAVYIATHAQAIRVGLVYSLPNDKPCMPPGKSHQQRIQVPRASDLDVSCSALVKAPAGAARLAYSLSDDEPGAAPGKATCRRTDRDGRGPACLNLSVSYPTQASPLVLPFTSLSDKPCSAGPGRAKATRTAPSACSRESCPQSRECAWCGTRASARPRGAPCRRSSPASRGAGTRR